MKKAQTQAQRLPNTLYTLRELPAKSMAAEADRLGITVVSIAEEQLMVFIGEAREGFNQRFGGSSAGR